jgi:hypothetical protein
MKKIYRIQKHELNFWVGFCKYCYYIKIYEFFEVFICKSFLFKRKTKVYLSYRLILILIFESRMFWFMFTDHKKKVNKNFIHALILFFCIHDPTEPPARTDEIISDFSEAAHEKI